MISINLTTLVIQIFIIIDAFGGFFVIFVLVIALGKVFFVLLFVSACSAEFFVVILVLLSPLIGDLFSIDDVIGEGQLCTKAS